MKVWKLGLILAIGATGAIACNSSKKQSGDGSAATTTTDTTSTGTSNSETGTTGQTSSGDTVSSGESTADPDSWLDGYYTGYNGTDKFSFYLPSFRKMTIDDASIAKIEEESVTLSTTTIDELVKEKLAEDSNFDEAMLREMLGKKKTVFKVTPLKAGTTKLRAAESGKGPGGSKGSTWSQGQTVPLVVTAYSVEQIKLGNTRYHAEGEGKKVACTSCHETGANGAPPHALGSILSLPDVSAAKWVTTGTVGTRKASVEHAWSFENNAERDAVVAYLRTLQAADLETLTKLEFENGVANLPPGGGKPKGETTTPTTDTETETGTGN